MTGTEQSAQKPSHRTAALATLRALLRRPGTCAPSRSRRALLALALLALPTLAATPASARTVHAFEASFGSAGSGDGQLHLSPTLTQGGAVGRSGLAVNDETHDVYIADTENHRVVEFSAAGTFIRAFGADVGGAGVNVCTSGCAAGTSTSAAAGFQAPTFIAIDNSAGASKGAVYVADVGDDRVSKFEPDGTVVSVWGSAGQLATASPLNGIAVDESGVLYVSTGLEENFLSKYDSNGTFLEEFLLPYEGRPSGIAVDSAGDIWKVRNLAEGALAKLSPTGEVIVGGAGIDGHADHGFAVDPGTGDLYVSHETEVFQYDLSGGQLDTFGPPEIGVGVGLAADPNGTVYVADTGHSRVDAFEPVIIPDVATEAATGFEPHSVVLHGHVEPAGGGEVTSCRFSYVEAAHYEPAAANPYAAGQTHACSPSTPYASPTGVSAVIAGLNSDTVYHFRLEAANAHNTFNTGKDETFTASPPLVKEEHVTDIEPKTATLNAVINPSGYQTHYHFQYGKTTSYGSTTTSELLAGAAYEDEPIQAAISGLEPETTYHYRALAESECEPIANPGHICLSEGPDQTFESLPPVSIRNFTTKTIAPELVILKAEINPNGAATHYTIHYGKDTSYSEGSSEGTLPVGNEFEEVTATFTGLEPSTKYHYQLTAENADGDVETADQTFETLPPVSIRNFTTQTVGPELVILKAEFNPNGAATRYTIHYGEDTSYSGGATQGNLAIGNEFKEVTATFSGLEPNTKYHYQLTAENSHGDIETADRTFTTERSSTEEREAEDCPNTNLREENNSLALSDCRAYEQVSPANKEGGQATAAVLAPGGERVQYASGGTFAGAVQNEFAIQYVAHRTVTGWITQAALAKRIAPPDHQPIFVLGDFSPELDRWYFLEMPGLDAEQAAFGQTSGYFSMGFADGSYNLHASPTITLEEGGPRSFYHFMEVEASSDDLSHIFIITASRDLPLAQDPRPDTYGVQPRPDRIYEISGADGPSPVMKLAAEVPLGLSTKAGFDTTGCRINAGFGSAESGTRPISTDGSILFYSAPIENVAGQGCGEGTPNPIALFARIDEGPPVQLNLPLASQCHSPSPCAGSEPRDASYDSVSEDGSRVWFTTKQPLVDSDTDSTNDLYMAKLENGEVTELVQASAGEATPDHPTPGKGADVSSVLRVSADGSHVVFESPAILTTDENSLHQSAVQGASNVYVYDAESGVTKFVTDAGISGGAGNAPPMTPDGRYLFFLSGERLTPDDTDNAADLYRYDFQTGQVIRLSFGRDGNDGNGNDDAYPVGIQSGGGLGDNKLTEDGTRSISSDGSTVIFTTAAPLVSRDTNGRNDIYEWEEQGHGSCEEAGGCISLVSDGVTLQGSSAATIGSSGRDITFFTTRNLIPADTDGVNDVYDARVDGGFHYSPPKSPCGGNEICHHEPPPPPPPPKITTENETGGNGLQQLKCAKGKVRVKKHGQVRCVSRHSKKSHKKHNRAGANRGGSR